MASASDAAVYNLGSEPLPASSTPVLGPLGGGVKKLLSDRVYAICHGSRHGQQQWRNYCATLQLPANADQLGTHYLTCFLDSYVPEPELMRPTTGSVSSSASSAVDPLSLSASDADPGGGDDAPYPPMGASSARASTPEPLPQPAGTGAAAAYSSDADADLLAHLLARHAVRERHLMMLRP
jgi:hypothetical protein